MPFQTASRNLGWDRPRQAEILKAGHGNLNSVGGASKKPSVGDIDDRVQNITAWVGCLRLEKEKRSDLQDPIPVEQPLAVFVNGRHAIDVTITPYEVREFVIGHLICEGHIRGVNDIDSLTLGEGWAEAKLRDERAGFLAKKVIFSGCLGSGKPNLSLGRLEKVDSDLRLGYEQLQSAMEAVMSSHVHRLTGGVHTCGIFRLRAQGQGELPMLVGLCDDIGRHNALDKAVGKAALKGCPLSRCFVVATGRASSEMVTKCYGAGIPILASRGATTTLAVEIAKLSGITLIGFARRSRINVYSNDWRVLGQSG